LTGYRLQFELGLFADARGRLLDYAPELFGAPWPLPVYPPYPPELTQAGATPSFQKRKWWQRLGSRLLRCLKAGDVILGSLAKVFPPAEIISQFKEGVEEGVTLAKGWQDR
jgi:hypothetical protein